MVHPSWCFRRMTGNECSFVLWRTRNRLLCNIWHARDWPMCQMLREKGESTSVRNSEDVKGPWRLIVMRGVHNRGVEEEKWTRMGKKVEWMWAKERERKKMCEKRMQWGWKLETKEAVNYNEIPTEIYYSHSISIKGRWKRKKKKKQGTIVN